MQGLSKSLRWCAGRFVVAAMVFCLSLGIGQKNVAKADGPASAAEALKLIPEGALAAVIVNDLAGFDAKLVKVGAKFNSPLGGAGPLAFAKQMHGIQDGLNDHGAVLLIAMPSMSEDTKTPFPILGFPVSDYEKFIANFATADLADGFTNIFVMGKSIWALKGQGYAWFISPHNVADDTDEAQQQFRKQIKKLLVDRPAEMSKAVAGSKDWILRQDVGLIVTTDGLKLGMSAAREGVKQMKATFEQIANMQLGENEEQAAMLRRQMQMARQGFDLYDHIFAWIDEEASQFVAGVRIDDDSTVRLASRTSFVTGSGAKELAQQIQPPSGAVMSGLPGGPYIAAFDGAFSGKGANWMTNYTVQMFKMMAANSPDGKLSDDDIKQLSEAVNKSMEGVRSMSMLVGVPEQGKSIYSGMIAVAKVEDSAKYLANYEIAMAAFKKFAETTNNAYLGKYDFKKTQIDGVAGLEVMMDFSQMIEQMKQQPGAGDGMKAYMEMLLGAGGKLSVFMQPVDKNTVVMAYVDLENLNRAKAALKAPQSGLAGDAGVKSTAALLPKGSQWMGFVSPSGVMGFAQNLLQALGQNTVKLPALGETPPVGFAVRLDGEGLDTELVIPGATLEGAGKAIESPR